MMRRRDFIAGAGSAAAWPRAARAQPSAMPVVGCLGAPAAAPYIANVAAIRQGLTEMGYVDGQNLALEFRWAEGDYARLPALAEELIRRQVTVIVTIGGAPAILAAKAATSTIPIVFHLGADPIQLGIVASLNRPGGNITGVTLMATDLEAKKLEFLHRMTPAAKTIAALINPTNQQAGIQERQLHDAAKTAGLKLVVAKASAERELEAGFGFMAAQHAGALLIGADVFFSSNVARLAELSARYRLPAIAGWRHFAAAGGLMVYGTNITDAYRLAGIYAGRILKGEKPGEMPVMEPTRFDLIVNLKTARMLNLDVPPMLLALAGETIE